MTDYSGLHYLLPDEEKNLDGEHIVGYESISLYFFVRKLHLMDTEEQNDTEAKAPSVVERYYTRWYRVGK